MNPTLRALVEAGALASSRAMSRDQWALTSAGRGRLSRARRFAKQLGLPESPQHREWRHKHAKADAEIGHYREGVREALRQAAALLNDERTDSEAWRALAERLHVRSELLFSAIRCLREWAEPDHAQGDADNSRPLEDRRRSLWHWNEDA